MIIYYTTLLTCSDTKPFFPENWWFLRTVKASCIPSFFLLFWQRYFINQNKCYIFMIRNDWSFFDQNWQYLVWSKLKNFILIFFNFNSLFLKNIFIVIFHSAMTLQRYQIYQSVLNFQKTIMARKTNAVNEKSYFNFSFNSRSYIEIIKITFRSIIFNYYKKSITKIFTSTSNINQIITIASSCYIWQQRILKCFNNL